MAFKNLLYLLIVFSLLSFALSSQFHHHDDDGAFQIPAVSHVSMPFAFNRPDSMAAQLHSGGEWVILHQSIGVSAMHMQLLYTNKVVIFDRTDFGISNISLPAGKCRYNDEAIKIDCSAHSVLYDVASNNFRPLMVQTDLWCSSGAVLPNGTLVQTGGYLAGAKRIRLFAPCIDESCDWFEIEQNLKVQRWYASNQILPDGRIIIVGGRRAFSYEFFPKDPLNGFSLNSYKLPFLQETSDPKEENNLYPFLHLMPDGNLYIFANQRSILFDYIKNHIVREFPAIPDAKRSYPATGSSVLLPFRLKAGELSPEAEVMICGGSYAGAYTKARVGEYVAASNSCGRIKVTDPDPEWVMEEMPVGRVMPDILLLPTCDVIILNGAANGTAGWELAEDPVLYPVLYSPAADLMKRFRVLKPTIIPRMYHSAATLLPDGRILVGGSNPHIFYNFTSVKYPTELSLEAFSPPYMDPQLTYLKPSIISVDDPTGYDQQFSVEFAIGLTGVGGEISVVMIAPSFTTHSFAMNQRLLVLDSSQVQQLSVFSYKVTVYAPPSPNLAPPGYYMLFVIHDGVPSHCVWIKMK